MDIWKDLVDKAKKKAVENEAEKFVKENKKEILYVLGGVCVASIVGAYVIGRGVGERRAYSSVVRCVTKLSEAQIGRFGK